MSPTLAALAELLQLPFLLPMWYSDDESYCEDCTHSMLIAAMVVGVDIMPCWCAAAEMLGLFATAPYC